MTDAAYLRGRLAVADFHNEVLLQAAPLTSANSEMCGYFSVYS